MVTLLNEHLPVTKVYRVETIIIDIPFVLGQKVWVMKDNKPTELYYKSLIIKDIVVGHTKTKISKDARLRLSTYDSGDMTTDLYLPIDEIFHTKKALVKSL